MTRTDAIAVRVRALNGHAVDPIALAEAIRVIQKSKTPTPHAPNKGLQSHQTRKATVRVAEVRTQEVGGD